MAKHSRSRHCELPVTVLSGFLGSGKTTLLRHILQNKTGLKCAVIVNDMSELNIDAALVKNGSLIQTEERLVEMQNGCICCTLREDLLVEVRRLAQAARFDYLLIESTGIGEPQQVAETFELSGPDSEAPLKSIARLDSMVTVVAADTLRSNLVTLQTLSQREGAEVAGGERNVADLLLDQIEFANVILLNKADLVGADEASRLQIFLRTLNPGAKVVLTEHSKVPLDLVLNTGRFDFEEAAKSAGWLRSLAEEHVPETEECGIASFVFRARRPFHTTRLWAFFNKFWGLQEVSPLGEEEEGEDGDVQHLETDDGPGFYIRTQPVSEKEAAAKQAALHSRFGQVLRSKGFMWLAGRDDVHGEWSQAGAVLRIGPGSPWFAAIPEEMWEGVDPETVKKDMAPEVGDRRQEIVFIGIDMKKDKLTKALEGCMCTVKEMKQGLERAVHGDPFLRWPQLELVEVTVSASGSEEESEEEEEEVAGGAYAGPITRARKRQAA